MYPTKEIPINKINVNERDRKNYGDVEDLADSIKRLGLVQPISVMEGRENGTYTLVAGGRRLTACKYLGLENITAVIRPFTDDHINLKEVELEENIKRKNLEWHEEKEAKLRLDELKRELYGSKEGRKTEEEGWSSVDTAKYLGSSEGNLYKDLALAKQIRKYPELKECKNASEALKMLKKRERIQSEARLSKMMEESEKGSPLETIKKTLFESYIVGDFLRCTEELDPDIAQVIEFDPPYCIQPMNYAIQTTLDERENLYTPKDESDFETVLDYHKFIKSFHKRIFKLLSPNGWLIHWTSYDWAFFIKQSLIQEGFKVAACPGFWIKNSGVTVEPRYNLGSSVEMFWYARKSPEAQLKKQGRINTFNWPTPKNKSHPTERPIELIQEILDTFVMQGSFLICPCAGSGNTALAAKNLQMNSLSFDISDTYLDSFRYKVYNETPGGYRSFKED